MTDMEIIEALQEALDREEARLERKARAIRKTEKARERKADHRSKREAKNWAMAQWEI